ETEAVVPCRIKPHLLQLRHVGAVDLRQRGVLPVIRAAPIFGPRGIRSFSVPIRSFGRRSWIKRHQRGSGRRRERETDRAPQNFSIESVSPHLIDPSSAQPTYAKLSASRQSIRFKCCILCNI